jgi:4-azaleucine resistance transporter AzlC
MENQPKEIRWKVALKAAFPYTLPIFAGFWFLGLAYGLLMNKSGFAFYWPMFMAMTIFSGSTEFIAVKMLLGHFHPLQSLLIALLIGARHLFYGISMLEKFKGQGWKKFFLIYGMCDETFSINYTAKIPKNVDKGWFMLWVTVLDYSYWVTGATLGGIFGNLVKFNTKGLGFVMTAMFVTIFMEQWAKESNHIASILGLILSALCLALFGGDRFVIPAMTAILFVSLLLRSTLEPKLEKNAEQGAEKIEIEQQKGNREDK